MISIYSEEVFADIRAAAWLEQELHPELDRHRRHQMADICEPDNADRVWRVLAVAVAELRLAMLRILRAPEGGLPVNVVERCDEWRFAFLYPIAPDVAMCLKEKIHEYLVAAVMADRAAVIIPVCARIWQERADEARSCIRGIAASSPPPCSPVRRPLWPL